MCLLGLTGEYVWNGCRARIVVSPKNNRYIRNVRLCFVQFNLEQFSFVTEALKHYGDHLSDYEKQEIEKYPEIWYLGLCSFKINAKPGTILNCGYDDDNGSYNEVSAEECCVIAID